MVCNTSNVLRYCHVGVCRPFIAIVPSPPCLLVLQQLSMRLATPKEAPFALYCLQHTTFLHSQCLLLATIPFSLQAATYQCSPSSFYHHILATTFLWQPITYYCKGYQMVCLRTFYSKRNAEIPFQGSNPFVQFQTILPSTLSNKIKIQQTH